MDGTLSDTAKATEIALGNLDAKFGLPSVTLAQIHDAMGLFGMEFFEHLYPNANRDILLEVQQIIDVEEDFFVKKTGKDILFSGVYDMLNKLVKNGKTLHIASTANQNHVNATLGAGQISGLFSSVSCGQAAKIAMVADIIANSDKSEWAMAGDMFKDSEAAKANGILAIGAGYGYLSKEDYGLFDCVIHKPEDIFKAI